MRTSICHFLLTLSLCLFFFTQAGWAQVFDQGLWRAEVSPTSNAGKLATDQEIEVPLPFREATESSVDARSFSFYLKAYMDAASLAEGGRTFDIGVLATVELADRDGNNRLQVMPPASAATALGSQYWKLGLSNTQREVISWRSILDNPSVANAVNAEERVQVSASFKRYKYQKVILTIIGIGSASDPRISSFTVQPVTGVSGDATGKYRNWVRVAVGYKADLRYDIAGVVAGARSPIYNSDDREITSQKSVSFAWNEIANANHVGVAGYKLQIAKLENQPVENLSGNLTNLAYYYAYVRQACSDVVNSGTVNVTAEDLSKAKARILSDLKDGKLIYASIPDWNNAFELIVSNRTQAQVALPYGSGFYTWRAIPLGNKEGKLDMRKPGAQYSEWRSYSDPPLLNPTPAYGTQYLVLNANQILHVSEGGTIHQVPSGGQFPQWMHLGDVSLIPDAQVRSTLSQSVGSTPTSYTRTWEGSPLFFFNDPDSTRNRIYERVVLEDNSIKEIEKFANGLDQLVQTQTYLSSDGKVLTAEKKYDFGGREAIETLPTVQDQPEGLTGYKKLHTEVPGAGRPYSPDHFDTDATIDNPEPVNDQQSGYDFYGNKQVGKAEGYPYKRTVYDPSDDKKVKEQSGFGKPFNLQPANTAGDAVHTTRHLYSNPTQEELSRIFGDELAPLAAKVRKELVVDPNGTKTIRYLDADGKTLATAIGYSDNKFLEESLDGSPVPRLEINLKGGDFDGVARRVKTNIYINKDDISPALTLPLTFLYNYAQNLPTGLFCNVVPFEAEYKVSIKLTRTDGQVFALNGSAPAGAPDFVRDPDNLNVIMLAPAHQFAFKLKVDESGTANVHPSTGPSTPVPDYSLAIADLPPGNYEVEKSLTCVTLPSVVATATEEATNRQTQPLMDLLKEWMGLKGNNPCAYKYREFVDKVSALNTALTNAQNPATGDVATRLSQLDATYKMLCRYQPLPGACDGVAELYRSCNCITDDGSGSGGTNQGINQSICSSTITLQKFATCWIQKFFTQGHSIRLLPEGSTNPLELEIISPCCSLRMPILLDNQDLCKRKSIKDADFSLLDKNGSGTLEINPFYEDTTLQEFYPDFEGYAYNFFMSCAKLETVKQKLEGTYSFSYVKRHVDNDASSQGSVTLNFMLKDEATSFLFERALNDMEYVRFNRLTRANGLQSLQAEMIDNAMRLVYIYTTYLQPSMAGFSKAGTVNLMVNKMLFEVISPDGTQSQLTAIPGTSNFSESIVSIKDWPKLVNTCKAVDEVKTLVPSIFLLAGNSAATPPLAHSEEYSKQWNNTYKCQDLFKCWTVQLNQIKQTAPADACLSTRPAGSPGDDLLTGTGPNAASGPQLDNNGGHTASQGFDSENNGDQGVHNDHFASNIRLPAWMAIFGAKRKLKRLVAKAAGTVRNTQTPGYDPNANPPQNCTQANVPDGDVAAATGVCDIITCDNVGASDDDDTDPEDTSVDPCEQCAQCVDNGGAGEPAELGIGYNLVEEFLKCTGKRYQRVLVNLTDPNAVWPTDAPGGWQELPMLEDVKWASGQVGTTVDPSVNYSIPNCNLLSNLQTKTMTYSKAWIENAVFTAVDPYNRISSYQAFLANLNVSSSDIQYTPLTQAQILDRTFTFYINGLPGRIWNNTKKYYMSLALNGPLGTTYNPDDNYQILIEGYTGGNRFYTPSWLWTGKTALKAKRDPFAYIFDPVFAYKYFSYKQDLYSGLEIETCFRDPNAYHSVDASGHEVITPYNPLTGDNTSLNILHYNPSSQLAGNQQTPTPNALPTLMVNYCEANYKYCLSTRRNWSCGQRESFYNSLCRYIEPSNDEIEALSAGQFVTPDDFASVGPVVPIVPESGNDANNDFTHLRFYPWDMDENNLASSAGFLRSSYTYPGNIRIWQGVPWLSIPYQALYRDQLSSYVRLARQNFLPVAGVHQLRSRVELDLNAMNAQVVDKCRLQYDGIRLQVEDVFLKNGYTIGNCVTDCDKTVTPEDISEIAWSLVVECVNRGIVTTYRTVSKSCRSVYAPSNLLGYKNKSGGEVFALTDVEYGVVNESELHNRPISTPYPSPFPSTGLEAQILTGRKFWNSSITDLNQAVVGNGKKRGIKLPDGLSKYYYTTQIPTPGPLAGTETVMHRLFGFLGSRSYGIRPAAFVSFSFTNFPATTTATQEYTSMLTDFNYSMNQNFERVNVPKLSNSGDPNYITTKVPNAHYPSAPPREFYIYRITSGYSLPSDFLALTRFREVVTNPVVVYGLRLNDVFLPNVALQQLKQSDNPNCEVVESSTPDKYYMGEGLRPGNQATTQSATGGTNISLDALPGLFGQNTDGAPEGGKAPNEFLFYKLSLEGLTSTAQTQPTVSSTSQSTHVVKQHP